jgi:hypothetical protein
MAMLSLVKCASARLVAATLAVAVSGCFKVVRQPKEPEMLKERIAYYKWLYEAGLLNTDPALKADAARALFGLRAEAHEHQSQVETEEVTPLLERLLEDLEKPAPKKAPPEGPARP